MPQCHNATMLQCIKASVTLWLISSAPDYWSSGPGFEPGICHSGKTLRTGKVTTVYTVKSRGREGDLPMGPKKDRKKIFSCQQRNIRVVGCTHITTQLSPGLGAATIFKFCDKRQRNLLRLLGHLKIRKMLDPWWQTRVSRQLLAEMWREIVTYLKS